MGSNRRLDLSGKDDPRKAGLLALGLIGSETERAPPCHQQTNVICHGVLLSTISARSFERFRSRSDSFSSSDQRRATSLDHLKPFKMVLRFGLS